MGLGIKTGVLRFVQNRFGIKIMHRISRGIDPFWDLRKAYPSFAPEIVFDIGANIGQSARQLRQEFPTARLFCFEPSSETFEVLQASLKGDHRTQCYNMAVGDEKISGKLELNDSSVLRRLVDDTAQQDDTVATEDVTITTVDTFCAENQLSQIDYLKIDTEGHELSVLAGAADFLKTQRVGIVELELGMNPENRHHTPFADGKDVMEQHGYRLFSIAEQVGEWPTEQQHLRRVNAIFVSQALIDAQSH